MLFHVTLEYAEDGWIVAECPALPGCVSQGKDEQEALDNIREAIVAWLWAVSRQAAKWQRFTGALHRMCGHFFAALRLGVRL
jgi:predicted RNase H-like HicB family nuclease